MISDTISHHRSLIIPCLPCHFAALEHHASPVPWSEGMTLQCSGIRPTICRWIYPPWSGERSPFTVKNLFTASANFCLTVVTRDLKRCSKLQSISLFAICLRSFLGRAISCRSSRLCSFANNIHCSLLSRPFIAKDAVSRARALLGDPFSLSFSLQCWKPQMILL